MGKTLRDSLIKPKMCPAYKSALVCCPVVEHADSRHLRIRCVQPVKSRPLPRLAGSHSTCVGLHNNSFVGDESAPPSPT